MEAEILEVIRGLKNGKVADLQWATSEQLKLLPATGLRCIAGLLTNILIEGEVPSSMKAGYKLPLLKPGKDSMEMTNYRGITFTSIYN